MVRELEIFTYQRYDDWMSYGESMTRLSGDAWDVLMVRHKTNKRLIFTASRESIEAYRKKVIK